MIQLW